MYSYLIDTRTKTFYMKPRETNFFAYSDPDTFDIHIIPKEDRPYIRCIETNIEDEKELETLLYNAGFFAGYFNGQNVRLDRQKLYYFDRNPNEISYAQFLMTGDKKYLSYLKKDKLYTLCKVENDFKPQEAKSLSRDDRIRRTGTGIQYPVYYFNDNDYAILTYTSEARLVQGILKTQKDKYQGWRIITLSWDKRCIINEKFILP